MTDSSLTAHPIAHHPLVDAIGDDWVATELRAPVVALTPALSDFLRRATTPATRAIVITGPDSTLTQPLWHALRDLGSAWVVRTPDGLYDAASGLTLTVPEQALHLAQLDERVVHPRFTARPIQTRLQLVATVATRHRVSRPVTLGGPAQALATSITGAMPTAWGPTEPTVAPWDRDELTEYSRRRMPGASLWTYVGTAEAPLVGTIGIERTSQGIEETTRVWADADAVDADRRAQLPTVARDALAAAAGSGMPLLGVVFAHVGAADLGRRPQLGPPPEPLALLVGPPGVRQAGLAPDVWVREFGATLVGRPRLPGVIVPLGTLDGGGWSRVSDVIERIGTERVADLMTGAPAVAEHLDDRPEGGARG